MAKKKYIEVTGCHDCPKVANKGPVDCGSIWCFNVVKKRDNMARVNNNIKNKTFHPCCANKWATPNPGDVIKKIIAHCRRRIRESAHPTHSYTSIALLDVIGKIKRLIK